MQVHRTKAQTLKKTSERKKEKKIIQRKNRSVRFAST